MKLLYFVNTKDATSIGAPGLTTYVTRTLLGAKGIATRSKNASRSVIVAVPEGKQIVSYLGTSAARGDWCGRHCTRFGGVMVLRVFGFGGAVTKGLATRSKDATRWPSKVGWRPSLLGARSY